MSKFREKLNELGFDNYNQYLNSPHWKDVRRRYYQSKLYHGHCECCFRQVPLQLHHKTYKRLGNENLNDFVTLCKECHTKSHDIIGTRPNASLWTSHKRIRKQMQNQYVSTYPKPKKEVKRNPTKLERKIELGKTLIRRYAKKPDLLRKFARNVISNEEIEEAIAQYESQPK